jgi:hypothetical protein
MKVETLVALCKSIAHWDRLASGKLEPNEQVGRNWCDLCSLFNNDTTRGHKLCIGCPVHECTGETGCKGTPYDDAYTAESEYGLDSPEFKAAALKQLEFLRSLLPKDQEVEVVDRCNCAEFKKAQERGTDGEGYGRLIYHSELIGYLMGSEFPPINYCPWCGKAVPKETK